MLMLEKVDIKRVELHFRCSRGVTVTSIHSTSPLALETMPYFCYSLISIAQVSLNQILSEKMEEVKLSKSAVQKHKYCYSFAVLGNVIGVVRCRSCVVSLIAILIILPHNTTHPQPPIYIQTHTKVNHSTSDDDHTK